MDNRIADKHINYIFLNSKRDYVRKKLYRMPIARCGSKCSTNVKWRIDNNNVIHLVNLNQPSYYNIYNI